MGEGQMVRFRIGDGFPADDVLSRWMTVCAMALNDLLLINRWLVPRLQDEVPALPGETPYLGRLAAGHLFEAATFLRKSQKRHPEVRAFVAGLDEEVRDAYAELLEIGDGGHGELQRQLKHSRNKSFHYESLLTGPAEEQERLKQAMADHAEDEDTQGVARGLIEDCPPPITGFRAVFADDIAVEMSLPKGTGEEFGPFLEGVSTHIAKFLIFAKAALNAYTETRPKGTWDVEEVSTTDVA
jgi:hypothetical protein